VTFSEQLPRQWPRALAIGVIVVGVLWIATLVSMKSPNGWLTLLGGVLLLPLGIALARNLDGMATVWGRRALASVRGIGAFDSDLDQETRDRVAAVRAEGAGRQAGGILVGMALLWIVLGILTLAGGSHAT
jgi:hypothetical protein